jgi:cell division protein ZapA
MRSVEVQILGQSYSIRTDEDEAYVKKLAKYVDDRLKEVYKIAPNINHAKAAIMVAFGIADELHKLKIKQEDLDRLVDEKTEMLSGLLEQLRLEEREARTKR